MSGQPAAGASRPALCIDPARLRERLHPLWMRHETTGLNGAEVEALAEACFRLAVHQGTAVEEALGLLRYAARCDETNPKFAYHLARLYFVHGNLDGAVTWLERATTICPTSHRVWTHVSLLQRELDRRHQGDKRFEPDALRRRSETLAERVKEGADRVPSELLDLHPPPAPAPPDQEEGQRPAPPGPPGGASVDDTEPATRLLDAGRCRWTGIHDLLAEDGWTAPPSDPGRDRTLPALEQVASLASTRRGGVAAFAILAVEWLVSGYPVATIRRLQRRLPSLPGSPSLDLLELVCSLYEADEGELVGRIATAIDGRRIPPLLAAVVHYRRLLWHPLSFPELGPVYRAARRFLDGALAADAPASKHDEAAADHEEKLLHAARALEVERPAPIEDVVGTSDGDSDPIARVRRLSDEVRQRRDELEAMRRRLKELAEAEDPFEPHEHDEVAQIAAAVSTVDGLCAQGRTQVRAIKENGIGDPPAISDDELNAIEENFRPKQQLGPLRKLLVTLEPRDRATQDAAEYQPTGDQAAEGSKAAVGPNESAVDQARLERVLERINQRIAELTIRADATIDGYPEGVERLPPIRGLRVLVRARQAETQYRLGHHRQARVLWSQILRDDRLRLAAMKNIAVSDSIARDGARSMESWRTYLEMLYGYAILAGSPDVHAGTRVRLHRELGGAYAPLLLATPQLARAQAETNPLAVGAFLGNSHRVRLYVRHKLLEALNAKLDFSSPSLILGVDRADPDDVRLAAKSSLQGFVTDATSSLPSGIRRRFWALAYGGIADAYDASKSVRLRTLAQDLHYPDEVGRHLQWIQSICELKLQFYLMVAEHRQLLGRSQSANLLNELAPLDRIPLANNPEFLRAAGRELAARADPALFQNLIVVLRKEILGT